MKKLSLILALVLAGTVGFSADLPRLKISTFGSPQARILNNVIGDIETDLTAQDALIATVTVVGADLGSAGTGTITVQLVDSAGVDVDEQSLIRTWIGTADDFGADALTDYSVTTGTEKEEVTANAEYIAITDTNGVIVMAVDAGGADSVWAWVDIGGLVVSSGEVVLTAP
jgi:hypothetical protein